METLDVFHCRGLADFTKRGNVVDAKRIASQQKTDNLDPPMIGQSGHHSCPSPVSRCHRIDISTYCHKSIYYLRERIFRRSRESWGASLSKCLVAALCCNKRRESGYGDPGRRRCIHARVRWTHAWSVHMVKDFADLPARRPVRFGAVGGTGRGSATMQCRNFSPAQDLRAFGG